MRAAGIGAIAIFAIASASTVRAECRFSTGQAIMCLEPRPAAEMFMLFGFDAPRTNQPANRALMQESGCGRPYGLTFKAAKVQSGGILHIPFPDHFVDVTIAVVNDADLGYVASAYLSGICDKVTPSKQ